MLLTKEKAIEEHRKMWNWIADQYAAHVEISLYDLKRQYCLEYKKDAMNHCFCCEYNFFCEANDQEENECNRGICAYCPVVWGTEKKYQEYYCERQEWDAPEKDVILWTDLLHETADLPITVGAVSDKEFKKFETMARHIANLPEK